MAQGTKPTPGSLGWGDPRDIAQKLEDAGITVWLDIKQKWEVGIKQSIMKQKLDLNRNGT